jgi:hypothetical protein
MGRIAHTVKHKYWVDYIGLWLGANCSCFDWVARRAALALSRLTYYL